MISTPSPDTAPDAATGKAPRASSPSAQGTLRVGDLLLNRGVISQAQLDEALAHQKDKGHERLLGEVLVGLKMVTEEQVLGVLAEAYGVPFTRLSPRLADPRVAEVLPRQFLEQQCVMPLFVVEDKLTIAVHEPANVFLIEEIERLSGKRAQVVAATAKDIQATLQSHLPDANVFVIDEMMDGMGEEDLSLVEKQVADLADLEDSASESPVIKLVNYLIYAAVEDQASDIHIEPGDKTMRVRYRVDGRLYEKLRPPSQMLPAVASRIKIMAGLDIAERRIPQDGGITVMIHKRPIDLRVSVMPGKVGEKVVIRIIDTRNALTSLEKLGFSMTMLERFRQLVHQPNGVVLVTGPTGSGKSTTLYASLAEINDESINISTVEDPVEYNLPGVNQFQTHDKAGFTFASALRSLLRQDPDVIMVGEVRDAETAKIATQAALTGHLVLSTLHTNDAPAAITRLYNIGVEPYLIAASVRGVLAQRLVRKICSNCKEPVEMTPATRRMLGRFGETGEAIDTLYQGTGCSKCRNTGFAGRIGIYELYAPDDEALDAISRGASLQELRRMARNDPGFIALQADGLEKVRAGLTTVEELFKTTSG